MITRFWKLALAFALFIVTGPVRAQNALGSYDSVQGVGNFGEAGSVNARSGGASYGYSFKLMKARGNGLGEPVLSLANDNANNAWIASGYVARDAAGRPTESFRPWSYTGAGNAAAVVRPAANADFRTTYDALGRPKELGRLHARRLSQLRRAVG
jgi:hypothetical protein